MCSVIFLSLPFQVPDFENMQHTGAEDNDQRHGACSVNNAAQPTGTDPGTGGHALFTVNSNLQSAMQRYPSDSAEGSTRTLATNRHPLSTIDHNVQLNLNNGPSNQNVCISS